MNTVWINAAIMLLFILLLGCVTNPSVPSDNNKTVDANDTSSNASAVPKQPSFVGNMSVTLEIDDSVPKSLVIQNDGTVVFTEGDTTNQIKISSKEMESLEQSIIENDFFSLNERYEGSGCCDFIGNTIIVILGNNTHSVYCYNDCPENFNEVERKIKSTWPHTIQYVGFA
ncbi:MAG TPA: hypothetical protein VI912_01085 [Candidatus Bilamarchaeaceae archaeon]|nr:hypothetical protein [Candidatus Bilamarchaeaceae archaeon]